MNYFLSDIHGASCAYFEMKNRIGLKNNDDLYILGDIFDGNDSSPGNCLEILEDVMAHDNIHLVLGDHEYAYVMHHISLENEEIAKAWESYITGSSFNGVPLFKHFYTALSQKEQDRYISYLIGCEVTELIEIGKRYFYLVHGSPAVCKHGDVSVWQKDVVTNKIALQHNYSLAIASTPDMKMPDTLKPESTYIISGHVPTKEFLSESEELAFKYLKDGRSGEFQCIIFESNKMAIDCGCNGNEIGNPIENRTTTGVWKPNLACVAIDAAGFFVEYLL